MSRARVIIADDHLMVAEGLRRMLEPEYDVVELATDGQKLINGVRRHSPEVVLIDITMPLMNGIDATRRVLAVAPAAKVLIVTMHTEPAYVAEALNAGAHGYVLKHGAASELKKAITAVLSGHRYLSPLARLPEPPRAKGGREQLSPRQRDVVRLIAEGHAMKEIADLLSISVKTVEFHRARTISRLGVSNTAGLIRYAVEHGMVIEVS